MVSVVLLDVNVLLALSWDQHQFHAAASRWREAHLPKDWATCPFTECGFVRISSQPRFRQGASLPLSMEILQDLRKRPGHVFWPNDYSPADEAAFAKLQGHNQVTDAYLLMLAVRHKGKLATFDTGIKALARELLGDDKRVLLIPSA